MTTLPPSDAKPLNTGEVGSVNHSGEPFVNQTSPANIFHDLIRNQIPVIIHQEGFMENEVVIIGSDYLFTHIREVESGDEYLVTTPNIQRFELPNRG